MPYKQPESIKALKERMKKGNWFEYFSCRLPELDEAMSEFPEHVPCPVHGGSDGFRLFDDAEDTGGGVCNTCGAFSDGIALTRFIKGCNFFEAVEMIEEWEQEQEGDNDDEDVSPVKLGKEVRPIEYNEYAIRYINRVIAQVISPHERIKRYYTHRGLTVDPSPYIGLMLNEKYTDQYEELELPAMVALFLNHGDPVCVHRTYLDPDGDGKADVEKQKKFSPAIYPGATSGCAIQLRDYSQGLLGIAEGIETAESIYEATRLGTWAAGSAGNMSKFNPPDDVKRLCVFADNDKLGVGLKAAKALRERMKDRDIAVRIYMPPDIDGVNDWLDILVKYGAEEMKKMVEESVIR